MKRINLFFCSLLLGVSLTACSSMEHPPSAGNPVKSASTEAEDDKQAGINSMESGSDSSRLIQITTEEGSIIVFALNQSTASEELYSQLPLSVEVENYAGNEKIFYLPEKLDVGNAPSAQGPAGTLAYYAPWGNIAVYYGECGGASGLYGLGETVSGTGFISEITGEIQIEAVDVHSASPGSVESESRTASPPEQSSTAMRHPFSEAETGFEQVPPSQPSASAFPEEDGPVDNIQITVGDNTFTAVLYGNEAARAFAKMLPLSIDMNEMNGNEKYYYFSDSLPADPSNPPEIHAGDLMLYDSDCLVLFYQSFPTSYSYTPLGRIRDPSGLAETLKGDSAQVSFQ